MVKDSILSNHQGDQSISTNFKYKGVRKRKWGKFVSEIRLPNSRERIWLGSYDTAEKAALAFDAALFCLRGHSVKLNFPDHPPDIANRSSLSREEIQKVAAGFAQAQSRQTRINNSGHPAIKLESCSPSISDPSTGPFLDDSLVFDDSLVIDDSLVQLQYHSPSLSEGSTGELLMGNELPMDNLFLDVGLGNGSGYGFFPDFDFDYLNQSLPLVNSVDYDNLDSIAYQDSFLWSF